MSKAEYWIWLSEALGAGARNDEVLSAYPDPEALYRESRKYRAISGVFSKQRLDRLEKTPIENALTAVEVCRKNGWKIITPDSADYPEDLKNLTDMPLVLYVDGDISFLNKSIAIGVVGTREPTFDSVKIAESLSGDMARCGAVIVSGGALGIDSAAHKGALDAQGKTVCVLGCGLGTRYLMQNSDLRAQIAASGAVISEYSPFSPASVRTFPIRNRIISGLSKGVLVIEAGEKSGSLITAKCALDQGREVFAVPGNILSSAYTGANRLIRDGAKAVTCAKDILEPFDFAFPGRLNLSGNTNKLPEGKPHRGDKKINSKKALPPDFGEDARAVYALLTDEPLHSDEICALTGLPSPKVMAVLTELEIGGFAQQTEGKNYIFS